VKTRTSAPPDGGGRGPGAVGSALDAGTFDCDLATRLLTWDDRLAELFGRAPGTPAGTIDDVASLIHPADRAHLSAAVRTARAGDGRFGADFRVMPLRGPMRWIAARGRAITGTDGIAPRLVGAAFELVDREPGRDTTRDALLSDVTSRLVGTLDPEEGVARLAQIISPAIAEWCVITLVGDGPTPLRGLRDLGWWHTDPERLPLVERYASTRLEALGPDSHLARVLRSGEPVVMMSQAQATISRLLRPGPAREVLAELAPWSGAVLPLRGRGRIVGLLSVFDGPHRPLTPDDLAVLQEIADRAGLAMDNARLYAQQRDLAQSLQRSLLTEPPPREGLEIAVRYVPAAAAAQVGGDWYDVLAHREGATTFVIGDVMGHDTAAVATMGQLRGMLRGIALSGSDGPHGVVTKLDEVILTLGTDVTASAVVARLGQGRLRWANAGHPPPMIAPGDGGDVVALGRATNDLLLGIDMSTPRHEHEAVLRVGDVLLLYTDGLVERRGQSLDAGIHRLARTLAALRDRPLDQLCDQVLADLLPARPEDDVAILAVRVSAEGRPPAP